MGVPRFFRYIQEEHSNVVKQIPFSGELPVDIDNLYIDSNGIIHNSSQKVYFSKKGLARKPALKHFFNVIFGYINNLVHFVKPQKLVYIAIDGVAPIAKQSQQRQRRYKASFEKDPETLAIFDSTSITPGTVLLYQLGRFLQLQIREKMMNDPVWSNLKVILSSSNVPGEGEHKIVNYISTISDKTISHCMYGLDADLFMLSIRTHREPFYLLREDQFTYSTVDDFFHFVDIGLLRKELYEKCRFKDSRRNLANSCGNDSSNEEQDIIRTLDDFVLLSFLIGNDFLHALPCLNGEDVGLNFDYMIEKRKEVGDYLTEYKKLNFKNFYKLLKLMGKDEKTILFKKYFSKSGFPDSCLRGTLVDDRHPEKGIDYNVYRQNYYKKVGINIKDKNQVDHFCDFYIKTLDWVNSYYYERPLNWKWLYPYHYTPLLSDLMNYMKTTSKLSRIVNDFEPALLPFEQLLCVVPPQNVHLIPEYLQHLYYKPELAENYPKEFNIDLDGKLKEWEGIALLPFVNVNQIQQEYEQAVAEANRNGVNTNLPRNSVSKNVEFKGNSKLKGYDFKNEYGEIKGCKIEFKHF